MAPISGFEAQSGVAQILFRKKRFFFARRTELLNPKF